MTQHGDILLLGFADEIEFICNPGQVIINAHKTTHKNQGGNIISGIRDACASIDGNYFVGDAMLFQVMREIPWPLKGNMLKNSYWFHDYLLDCPDMLGILD